MAATLTGELTRVTVADISKWEDGPDGTLYVYGRCTTPEIDTDDQVVDSSWSGASLKEWLATAPALRVQHNAQRDPAGSGVKIDVNRDGDGAHWLKAAVDEPVAQRLVKRGHLRAFSVGIARPVIERDISGKARGGIIRGGKVVEVSLVDSPANRSCFLELAKADKNGVAEWSGKVFADDDAIAKALGEPTLTKGGDGASADGGLVSVDLPADMPLTCSPAMLAKMNTLSRQHAVRGHYDDLAEKAVLDAEAAVYKRDIDTATRRRLASEGKALPGDPPSYPIENAGDLGNAATLARSGHGDVAAARRLIARRAKELGVANPLDEGDEVKKSGSDEEAALLNAATQAVMLAEDALKKAKEAEPEVTKEPETEDKPEPARKAKGKPKGKKKLPPWLNKPADDDAKDGGDGACKSASEHLWTGVEGTSDIVCSKCHTTPAEAAGVTASPMDPAPVGELMESTMPASVKGATPQSASGASDAPHMDPVPQHREPDGAGVEPFEHDAGLPATGQGEAPTRLEAPTLKASPEVSALLRFRAIGIDPELGKLHDLTCPAFHPDDVQRFHPFADIASLIDEGAWQRKSLEAACGPFEQAIRMHELMQAALALKAAGEADLNQWRADAHKAFRDANPGPSAYPSPGAISPQKYNRPLLEQGRAATSTGHSGPNTSPQVATMAPNAHDFDRPPLAGAHASPSPSFMKAGFPYPAQQGVPAQLVYARQVQEQQHAALEQMHSHLGAMYPAVCPMDLNAAPAEMRHPVPATAGTVKGEGGIVPVAGSGDAVPVMLDNGYVVPKAAVTPALVAAVSKAPAEADLLVDADVYKGFKKQQKKLGRKVLAGKMTVDEARARMGRRFAQKGAGEGEAVQKAAAPDLSQSERVTYQGGALTPDLIKAAVREALHVETVPLEAVTVEAYNPGPVIEAAVTKAVGPLLEKIRETDTKLAEAQRVIDAIADQPDPATASFSGLAYTPVHKSRPAGVTEVAEGAARARQNVIRELESIVNSASDPYEREAAYASLRKYQGGDA